MIVAAFCERRFFKTTAVTDRRYRVGEFLWTQKCSERKVKIVKGVLLAGSVSGPRESQSTSMTLHEGHVLLLACDNRGYVIFAQLEDKKWEWKKDETVKKP
jgi:DNA polymerase III alpha subunit